MDEKNRGSTENRITRNHYEKKADWMERLALAVFGSTVLGPFVSGEIEIGLIVIGSIATGYCYGYANYLLDTAKKYI
jgi:hypothetical protein